LLVLVRYTMTGSGPAVVLLHSTAADSRQWDGQRGPLAAQRTVITPDLRGYGKSPLPAGSYSHAGDIVDLLDHIGLQTTALVGSSGGGKVALQIALRAPERVSALVLLCASADGVEPTADLLAFAEREGALLDAGDVAGATELNVATWLGPEADDAARESLRVMQEHAFRVQLATGQDSHEQEHPVELSHITAPATVICGGHDLEFFRVVARHLASTLPHALYIELPWAGHLPNLERPAETTALIAQALSA
jgi:3-oxoadipate enol-lactonase